MFKPAICDEFVTAIAQTNGMSVEEVKKCGLTVRPDSNDWASSDRNAVGFIMWEEGPYEWVYADLEVHGYYAETICGWGLIGIYPI